LVEFLSCPNPYRASENQDPSAFLEFLADELIQRIETIGAENIACFIGEPILGAGGVIVPPAGYHKRTFDICAQYDIKYISDEVVTAFGRLGSMFASLAVFDIQPDIITSAKGLTSGYQPMSATIISDEIFDVISGPDAKFLHGMTYSGHPACSAAALANIAIIEDEGLCQHVRDNGPLFEKALHSLSDLDIVGEVRGSHFMMGIEFVADKVNKTVFDIDIGIGARVAAHAQSRGLIVRPLGHMAVLSPPLILDNEQIENIASILAASIAATSDDLVRERLL
jgi:adenosylmethionine-8-amino-7-oxononanoate aminotransferase